MTTTITETGYGSLGALAEELLRQQETKVDYLVDTRKMSLHTSTLEVSDGEEASALFFDAPDGTAQGGGVRERAHRQIGERVGIPRRYYTRMQAEAPGLLDQNVNHWLHAADETRMIRMLDGKVRAFVSNRYRRLDNLDLMERAILPVFQNHRGDLVFQAAHLTDDRLYLRALLPKVEGEIKVGDVVQAGVEISNSEVGAGALTATPFIWRLVCKNGMRAADRSLSRYHVGRVQEEEAFAIYRDDTLEADDAAYFLKVRDAIGAALSQVTFDQIVEQLRSAANGMRVENPVAATEKLAQRFSLDGQEQSNVLRLLAEGGDFSRWGMLNAVTAAAKASDSFERQAEMESVGGAIAALDENEWAKVAVAV